MFFKEIVWNLSLYDMFLMFYIYGFLGWCVEVVHATLKTGKFINRGFLNGTICPIYGVGIVLIMLALTPLQDSLPLLFVGAVLITSLLEFVVGLVLEKIFKLKWWDYSKEHYNIKGYVCIKYSLYWGIACLLVVKLIQAPLMNILSKVPEIVGVIFIILASLTIITDFILTILQLKKYNERIKQIDELTEKFKAVSTNVGENIYKLTIKVENSRIVKAFPSFTQKIKKTIFKNKENGENNETDENSK